MAQLQTRIEEQLRSLGWRTAKPCLRGQFPDRNGTERVYGAEGVHRGERFRLLLHDLEAAASWIFYQRPAQTIARPEPLAGIIPLDLSSCNLPRRSQVFVRRNARFSFHYADEGLEAESRRDLLPEIARAAGPLRRCFLQDYLTHLREEAGHKDLFYLNLLVTDASVFTVHPEETPAALAGGDPAAFAWESGFVPLFLPPPRLHQLEGPEAARTSSPIEEAVQEQGKAFLSRASFLTGQLPGIYWLLSADHLEESLRFILSYARRWSSPAG